jgi:hypothetical protein
VKNLLGWYSQDLICEQVILSFLSKKFYENQTRDGISNTPYDNLTIIL